MSQEEQSDTFEKLLTRINMGDGIPMNKYMEDIARTYDSLDKDSKQIVSTLLMRHYGRR